MAKFEEAYAITAKYEGGYVNDKDDTGGETIFGVARNFWPALGMWNTLDTYKKQGLKGKALEQACRDNHDFMREVETVYYNQFWLPIYGNDITNQNYANALYDFAVNTGVTRAVKYAQQVTNQTQDGKMGKITLAAINASEDFLTKYTERRIKFYNDLVAKRPSNAKFLKGWTNRAKGFLK